MTRPKVRGWRDAMQQMIMLPGVSFALMDFLGYTPSQEQRPMHYFYRTLRYCRLCRGSDLVTVFSLGEQSLAHWPAESYPEPPPRAPLTLVRCAGCGLVQLRDSVNPELLYSQYFYRSATGGTMRQALDELAQVSLETAQVEKGDIWLDIGSNDWYLLSHAPEGVALVGVDPAFSWGDTLDYEVDQDMKRVVQDYFSWEVLPAPVLQQKCKLVTSAAVFYDVEDPVAFARDVADVLHRDGVWVNQLNYAPDVCVNSAFDFVSHEHLTCWSLATLVKCLDMVGLEVFDFETLPLNGGSARFYIGHQGSHQVHETVANALDWETDMGDGGPYPSVEGMTEFWEQVVCTQQNLPSMLKKMRAHGKRVHAYGASTRGWVIMQACGLDSDLIDAVWERDPQKVGRYYGDSGIPIISEEEGRHLAPDALLVLPYSYLDEFVQREQAFLQSGGVFVTPLPKLGQVSA